MKSILGLRYLAHKKIKDRWVAQGYLKVLAPLEGKWNTVRVKGSEICFPNTREAPVKKLCARIQSLRESELLPAAAEMRQATRWTPRVVTRSWFRERSSLIIAFLHLRTCRPSWTTRRCWS